MTNAAVHEQVRNKLPGFKQFALPAMQGKQIIKRKTEIIANNALRQKHKHINNDKIFDCSW